MGLTEDDVAWDVCDVRGCLGAQFAGSQCVVHGQQDDRAAALASLARGEECKWTQGLTIHQNLMRQIRLAASRSGRKQPRFPAMLFTRATFHTPAQFASAVFSGEVRFDRCTFEQGAEFGASQFSRGCSFWKAEFKDRAFFKGVRIGEEKDGRFVPQGASFAQVSFRGTAAFNINQAGDVDFTKATFDGDAVFYSRWGSVSLNECRFDGPVRLDMDTVACSLRQASFAASGDLGTISARQRLNLAGTEFREAFSLGLSARAIRADLRTLAAARIEFRGDLDLREARFGGTTLVTAIPDSSIASLRQEIEAPDSARLIGLGFVDVGDLTLGAVDLSPCTMVGAHGLDRMKIEPAARWASTPQSRWITRRRLVADEAMCRAGDVGQQDRAGSEGRNEGPDGRASSWPELASGLRQIGDEAISALGGGRPLPPTASPAEIAGVYRALRKGREDERDAPGAADFYYGEMEMRRKAAPRGGVEWFILSAYWLSSGYALRAWRAFAALVLLVLIGATVFVTAGFDESPQVTTVRQIDLPSGRFTYNVAEPDHGLWDGVTYSVQSATSLLRPTADRALTRGGDVMEIVLRLAGPLLLGLAILALRGRVKR